MMYYFKQTKKKIKEKEEDLGGHFVAFQGLFKRNTSIWEGFSQKKSPTLASNGDYRFQADWINNKQMNWNSCVQ